MGWSFGVEWAPRRVFAIACATVVMAGCASGEAIPDRVEWGVFQIEVTDVRAGADASTALLVTNATVAPECQDDPVVDVTVDAGRVFVTVYAMYSPDSYSARRCAMDATVREFPVPLGDVSDDLVLIVNGENWEPDGDGGYARCDIYLGCGKPPEDPCDGYLGRFVSDLDLPQHSSQGISACDGMWMVYSVDPATSYCGPSDGESTCDVPSQQRYAILRFDPEIPAWQVVRWVDPPVTCDEVIDAVPEMTRATCRGLFPGQ